MADRAVFRTGKDSQGDITSLCGRAEDFWSPRAKADAIRDIKNREHRYTAYGPDGNSATIEVVNGSNGEYLRTNWDGTTRNNLDDLPDC